MNSELIERLRKCNKLPSIPSGAIKILDFVRSHVGDFYEITKTIEQDPELTAKLIKYANTTFYGQGRKHQKIQDAVILFGARTTLSIALILSLVSTLQKRQGDRMDYERFWKRSLLAAAYAQTIERHICCTNTGEALFTSLLQDIGMLALDRIEPTLYPPIKDAADYHDAARAQEQTLLAVDHAAVGGWLLNTWGLPDNITNAVERSHYPFASNIKSPFNTFDKIIVLSGLMADIVLNEDWVNCLNRALSFGHTWLDLTKRDFVWIHRSHGPQVSEFEALLNTELFNKKKLDTILEMATSLLNDIGE